MFPSRPSAAASDAALARPGGDTPPSIAASQLFQGQSTLVIEHRGEFYQLRITRNGKLILTK